MSDDGSNRVRELREARGLSQLELAASIRLSRQSVHAIESGKAIPGVDIGLRIARVLGCSVESLFGDNTTSVRLTAETGPSDGKFAAGRVALASVRGRLRAYSLMREGIGRSADAIALRTDSRGMEVEVLRPTAYVHNNVVMAGCAPALGVLADRLNTVAGPGRFLWFGQSSTQALQALNQQRAHVAGVHLVDSKTGEANIPDVRKHVHLGAVALVTLARWEVGLVVPKGNPKHLKKVAHLGRRGMRLIGREPGSGARRLLDRQLREAGMSQDISKSATVTATGHLEVASAISMGAGDVGVATRDAAIAYGLDFVALTEERYDLAVLRDDLSDPRIVRLFDVMTAAPTRRELAALGYDVGTSGSQVAELVSA